MRMLRAAGRPPDCSAIVVVLAKPSLIVRLTWPLAFVLLPGSAMFKSSVPTDSRLKEWMRRFYGVATHYPAGHLGWRRLIERTHETPSSSAGLLAPLGMNSAHKNKPP